MRGWNVCLRKEQSLWKKGGLKQTGNPSYGGEKVVFHLLQTVKLVNYIMFLLKR